MNKQLIILFTFVVFSNGLWATVLKKNKNIDADVLDQKDNMTSDFFDSPDLSKILDQIKKMRQEMMKDFGDKSLFKDFEDLRSSLGKSESSFFQAFSLDSNSTSGNLYDMKWRDEKTGRVLEIRPKDKKTELTIEVKNGYITIKGKQKTENNIKSSKTSPKQKYAEVQHFEYTQNVPMDLDEAKNKIAQKEGTIEVYFPLKESNDQPISGKDINPTKKSPQDKVPLFDSDKEDVI